MSGYTPPLNLQRVHDWPRFDASAGLARASNNFSPDWGTPDGKSYLSAVLSLSGVFFALGSVLFLLFLTVNCVIARKRAAGDASAYAPQRREVVSCCGRFCALLVDPRIWYIFAVVVMLAGTSTALAQVTAFQSALTKTLSSLDALDRVLEGSISTVQNALQPALANATTTANAFCADPQTQGLPAPAQQTICGLSGLLSSANTAASSLTSQLGSTVTGIWSQLRSGGSYDLSLITSRVYWSGLWFLIGFFGWLLATVATLWGNKMCATCFRRCNNTLVFLVLSVFLFSGFFMAIGVVGSDVCIAPPVAITSIVNLTKSDNVASSTIIFYTTCLPSQPYDQYAPGAYGQIIVGQLQVQNASKQIIALNASLGAAPWAQAYVASLSTSLAAANTTVGQLATGVGCPIVSPIFSDILTALCGDGIQAIVVVFALAALASVLITVMAFAGLRLNLSHPGDETYAYDAVDRGVFDDEVSGEEYLIGRGAAASYGTARAGGGKRRFY